MLAEALGIRRVRRTAAAGTPSFSMLVALLRLFFILAKIHEQEVVVARRLHRYSTSSFLSSRSSATVQYHLCLGFATMEIEDGAGRLGEWVTEGLGICVEYV
jgi:hypothetical protein